MKKLLVAAALAAALGALQGCSILAPGAVPSAQGHVVAVNQTRCSQGELEECWRAAMYQVVTGMLSNAEAADQFEDDCQRAAKRHHKDMSVCTGPWLSEIQRQQVGAWKFAHGN